MARRFNCHIPGFWRMLWLKMLYRGEWQKRCRTIITDTKTGYRFKVTEEEEAVMDLACDAIVETSIWEVISSRRRLNRAVELMCDEILHSMYKRRHGDPFSWSRYLSMSADDWRVWWAGHEAIARIEQRREYLNRWKSWSRLPSGYRK